MILEQSSIFLYRITHNRGLYEFAASARLAKDRRYLLKILFKYHLF